MALTEDHLKAAQLVFENKSSYQIAEALGGIHRNTVDRWRKLPEFIEAVAEIEKAFLDTTKRRARKAAAIGLQVQIQLATGKDEEDKPVDHSTRLQAANQLTRYLPLVAPTETKNEHVVTAQTPDVAAMAAEIIALEERERALLAKAAEDDGQPQ